jgi:hypothetical membrane protein
VTRVRALLVATVAGQLAYPAAWIVSGSLQHGYSTADNYVSDLGAPPAIHPWIMNAGLVLFGASFVTLAFALRPTTRWTVAPGLFAVVGLAFVGTGFLHESCWPMTSATCLARQDAGVLPWQHYAHGWLSASAGLLIDLSPLVIAFSLDRGTRLRMAARVCAAVGLAGAILTVLIGNPDGPTTGQGAVERLYAAVVFGWVLLIVAGLGLTDARRRAPGL